MANGVERGIVSCKKQKWRYASSVSEFATILSEKRFEHATLGFIAGVIVIASSTAITVKENNI